MSIFEEYNNKNILTFIIPTIGRETLNHSINSIINQTNKNWKCIIVFDGVKNNFDIHHENIEIYEIEKTKGVINQASDVRNYGIQKAQTNWIAFLDDDDTIADDFRKYLEIFRASIEERTLKIFVSFYYILMAIETKNGMWILSMVSASKKSIDADIMRVHINKDTGEITYTKPDCLKE